MDTEYIIDCAQELGEVSPLEAVVLNTHPDAYKAIRAIVDSDRPTQERDWIANECRAVLYKSPLAYRQAASVFALRYRDDFVRFMVERLEHAVHMHVSKDLGWDRARENRNHEILVLGDEHMRQHFDCEQMVNERSVHQLLDSLGVANSIKLRLQQDANELSQTIRQLTHEVNTARLPEVVTRVLDQDHQSGRPAWQVANEVRRRTQRSLRTTIVTSEMRKRAKSALKKASKLFTSLGKSNELNLFISGKEVTLSHPDSDLKFVVRSLGSDDWLIRRSVAEFTAHTPFELALLTKSDVFIGNLCVYFSESPVLDQILSLSLFIEAGDEEAILEKANIFGTSHWTKEFWESLSISSPHLLQRKERFLAPVTRPAGSPKIVSDAISEKYKKWEPFRNPVQQWVRSWFGEAVREYNALQVPPSLRTLQFDSIGSRLAVCLGLPMVQPRCNVPLTGAMLREQGNDQFEIGNLMVPMLT